LKDDEEAPEDYLTISQVAKKSGLAMHTIYNYVAEEKIKTIRSGRKQLIVKAEFDHFMKKRAGKG
jgi:excisionase family DNA binding protein